MVLANYRCFLSDRPKKPAVDRQPVFESEAVRRKRTGFFVTKNTRSGRMEFGRVARFFLQIFIQILFYSLFGPIFLCQIAETKLGLYKPTDSIDKADLTNRLKQQVFLAIAVELTSGLG